jgi:hypothetical protein
MKLFVLVSSLDLTQPFSATPAWWQLLKGLYEIGVDVIAAPYQGPAIESLWWRALPNPARLHGDTFKWLRDRAHAMRPMPATAPPPAGDGSGRDQASDRLSDRAVRRAAQVLVAPLWWRLIDRALTREPDIDAVLVLTAPLNQLVGLAERIQRKHGKPVLYYDGDVPASLPSMRGFASGFRIYQGADAAEYTAFISNSSGGAAMLSELGARAVHTLYYGVDPDVFSPVAVAQQDIDVMFYGHGREYRSAWIDAMITQPSHALPEASFAVRGTRLGDLGRARALPYLSFSKLREYACRSRLNLCITRQAHAGVFASSSSRPFELASMGCCMVSNPYLGVETWFEPNREIFIVHSADEAIERYRALLADEALRRRVGAAARARVLAEHTMQHRARQLRAIIEQYTGRSPGR